MSKVERTEVEGIASVEDREEFSSAVESWVENNGTGEIRVYQSHPGTVEALAYIFEYADSDELLKEVITLFGRYDCKFNASWIWDDVNPDYKAKIDVVGIPMRVCKEIVKQAKSLEKRLHKKAIEEARVKKAAAKEAAKKKKLEEKEMIEKLKKYRNKKRINTKTY